MKNLFYSKWGLYLLLIVCVFCKKVEKTFDESKLEIVNDEDGYFKGKIVLYEKDLFGITSNVTYTFNGNDVQREVKEKGTGITYGMIYQQKQDSVLYYYTNKEGSWYTSLPQKDFKNWVQSLERPVINSQGFDDELYVPEPFGTIFSPFNENTSLLTTLDCKIKNYGMGKCQTFSVPYHAICTVSYSEKIKIRPEILNVIEYNQPKSIPTLALQVKFEQPKAKQDGGFVDKVSEKINKVAVKIEKSIEFNKTDTTSDITISLPKNSKKKSGIELRNIINPPSDSKGGSSHHDFDIF